MIYFNLLMMPLTMLRSWGLPHREDCQSRKCRRVNRLHMTPDELETEMTETEDHSARLIAIETVLRYLVTHLALHSDDPPR